MSVDDLAVMSFPRKMVEQIVLGLSTPLNRHLIKLVGFDFSPETRRHFQREVRSWLAELQALRMKPNHRPGSRKFYYDLLFDYPFGGVEIENMRSIFDLVPRDYDHSHSPKTPEEMGEWLQRFHTELAERLHNGEAVLDMIPD